MSAKNRKSDAARDSRDRRDQELMRRLSIHHQPEDTPDKWPLHLTNTFKSIVTLSSTKYQLYNEDTPAQHSTGTWRREIKLRAKQLSDTAQRLLKENPSELTWRLELEKLVDARFNSNTECSICSNAHQSARIWRSEIEVVTECNGPITRDLESRRARRIPCQCDETSYNGLNRYFSNRADQAFDYHSDLVSSKDLKNITKRRPDRVYGLRQTSNFEQRLEKPVKSLLDDTNESSITELMDLVDSNTEEILVRNLLQATPFNQCGELLLFPFLTMEAKSENGGGFTKCGIQSSLPIWSLLKTQEKLSELGAPMNELGGPIVWYIAYIGDKWRVSGCCTAEERGQQIYEIIDLCDGRMSSPDGALQILLIMDYIFDWARDLYRPSILRSLEAFGDHQYVDSASVAADSDIHSSWKHPLDDEMNLESDGDMGNLDTTANNESLLAPWKKYDIKTPRGICFYDSCVFRPSYVIKSAFQCLYITRDNIGTLIASLGGNPQSQMKMAREAFAALRTGPLIMSERILAHIEDMWTGTARSSYSLVGDIKRFCSVTYRVSISDTWELTRSIVCFAIDSNGLEILRKYAKLQRKTLRLEGLETTGQIVDENAVTKILQSLKGRDHRDVLSHALSEIHEVLKPVNELTKQEYREIGPLAAGDIVLVPKTWAGAAIAVIVYGTYGRHKPPGLLEPDYPYLRFSARLEQLDSRMTASNIPILPLRDVEQPPKIVTDSVLVCHQNRSGNHLCVFSLKPQQDPPSFAEILSALCSALLGNCFFIMRRVQMFRAEKEGSRGLFITPTVERGDILSHMILIAASRWTLRLCNKFDKTAFEDLASAFKADTLKEALAELSSMENELYIGNEERPFAPLSKNRPAKRREKPYISETLTEVLDSPAQSLPGYTKDSEIKDILSRAHGDGLTDDQTDVLVQLGYFK